MRNIRFLAVIKPAEEGGFYAYCPLLPGCASQGETYAETVANIQDAIRGYIEVALAHGDSLPEEMFEYDYTVDLPVNFPEQLITKLRELFPGRQFAYA